MVRRGDIVLVTFPYTDGSAGKVRPDYSAAFAGAAQ